MVTAQTTEAIVETTIEAVIEVAKITKCQTKTTPRTANQPTEEAITPKEEEDKTEEVEEEITRKEEAKVLPSCRECFVNSVAKKATGKISATQRLIARNAKIKKCTQCQTTTQKTNNHNMTKTTMKPMKNFLESTMPTFLESTMLSQQKTKKWFS